jgi:hypothetical protein
VRACAVSESEEEARGSRRGCACGGRLGAQTFGGASPWDAEVRGAQKCAETRSSWWRGGLPARIVHS